MQRMEVSCAVRRIYTSLGAKRLNRHDVCVCVFVCSRIAIPLIFTKFYKDDVPLGAGVPSICSSKFMKRITDRSFNFDRGHPVVFSYRITASFVQSNKHFVVLLIIYYSGRQWNNKK